MEPASAESTRIMQEANRIIEDFSFEKYAIYMFAFLVETAIVFWVALKFM